jgi:Protein of unknown function (DUF2806)
VRLAVACLYVFLQDDYAHAAVRKFGQKIIRERVNVDRIAQIAASELNSGDSDGTDREAPEVAPVSEDWMNTFEDEAAQMSSEQMQHLFARILAGEIRRPSSYSIRTVRMLAQLDNTAAALFKVLCSLCMSLRVPNSSVVVDARVAFLGEASQNSLQPYGLSFGQLNILQEYGLIISDYNSWMDYRIAIAIDGKVQLPASYLHEQWVLVPKAAAPALSEFRVNGVAFTRSGAALLSIVDKQPIEQYTAALKSFFDQRGMVMTKVTSDL